MWLKEAGKHDIQARRDLAVEEICQVCWKSARPEDEEPTVAVLLSAAEYIVDTNSETRDPQTRRDVQKVEKSVTYLASFEKAVQWDVATRCMAKPRNPVLLWRS